MAIELVLGAFFGFACLVSLALIVSEVWEEQGPRVNGFVHDLLTFLNGHRW